MRIIQLDPSQLSDKHMTVTEDSYAVWQALPAVQEEGTLTVMLHREAVPKASLSWDHTLFDDTQGATSVWGLLEQNELRALLEMQQQPNGTLRICMLYVFEGFRRRGYGTLLAAKAKEIARRAGCKRLLVTARASSSGAAAFLMSQGMSFAGCDLYASAPGDPACCEASITFVLPL